MTDCGYVSLYLSMPAQFIYETYIPLYKLF